MANLKYSRQRETIKDYLSSVTTHPTADTVYMHIKEEFPNIENMKSYELLVDAVIYNYKKKQLQAMDELEK